MKQYINYRCSLVNKETGEVFITRELAHWTPEQALDRFREHCETGYMLMPDYVPEPNVIRSSPPAPADYPDQWEYRAEVLPHRWFECELWQLGEWEETLLIYAADAGDAEDLMMRQYPYKFRRRVLAHNTPYQVRITETDKPDTVALPAKKEPVQETACPRTVTLNHGL